MRQERIEGGSRAARLLHPALARIDPGIRVMRGLGLAEGAIEHWLPLTSGNGARRATRRRPP